MKITLKIPREIGEWIEYCKSNSFTIYKALYPVDRFGELIGETFEGDVSKCALWARMNSNEFAYAWVKGYEIDEKYYYVAIPIEHGHYRRLVVLSSGRVALGETDYTSIDLLKDYSIKSNEKLTERMIKDSPLSWAWQFAKELEL